MTMLIALIPAYNPTAALPELILKLKKQPMFSHIVVVNDGSTEMSKAYFKGLKHSPGVTLLEHAVNQGKGAALKTGLNFIACEFSDIAGVVTVDADGQHTVHDACEVAAGLLQNLGRLVIGGRRFDRATPFRSWLGNFFTRHIFRTVVGLSLFDTQSGLRGIPVGMIKDLLLIEANGYEFELDMLLQARHLNIPVLEIPITTVYLEGNKHSSFRPLIDSVRIYFVLLRFLLIAIFSALIDYGVFILIYFFIHPSVLLALTGGRIISTIFNYFNVKRFAFRADVSHWKTLPKYFILVCVSGLLAWSLITIFMKALNWHVVAAKVVAEFILFIINFLIQRDFIFKKFSTSP